MWSLNHSINFITCTTNVFCFALFLVSFNFSYLWNQLTNFNAVSARRSCENDACSYIVGKMKTEFD